MTNADTVTSLFENGLERYNAGESAEKLIPVFKDICDRAPKNAAAWASLAWLYLLEDKPNSALKAALKAVKADQNAPQARVNLAVAMLETGKKGVRQHIDAVQEMMSVDQEVRPIIQENIEDGLERKPAWQSLQRVKSWLLD